MVISLVKKRKPRINKSEAFFLIIADNFRTQLDIEH